MANISIYFVCLVLGVNAAGVSGIITCYECTYITVEEDTTTTAALNTFKAMLDDNQEACKDSNSNLPSTQINCTSNMCEKTTLQVTLQLTDPQDEKLAVSFIRRGCKQLHIDTKYAPYNLAGCHGYNENNPYAQDEIKYNEADVDNLDMTMTGDQCLCDTSLCNHGNGRPIISTSFITALMMIIMINNN